MMHSVTQLADTVMSRSVYNRETTVKHGGDGGYIMPEGGRASQCVGDGELGSTHGRSTERVSSSQMHMSASPQMKKFKPVSRHNVVISVAKAVILSFIKIYTTYPTMEGHRQ